MTGFQLDRSCDQREQRGDDFVGERSDHPTVTSLSQSKQVLRLDEGGERGRLMRALVGSGCWINVHLVSSGWMEKRILRLRGRFDSALLVAFAVLFTSLRTGGWQEIATSLIF